MQRKGVIYKCTFKNGKVYIGQTRRAPMIRFREHLDPNIGPANTAFWAAYQEQGEPTFEILEEYHLEDLEQLVYVLNQRETENIRLFKAIDPEYGYNRVAVGMVSGRLRKKLHVLAQKLFNQFYELKKPLWDSMLKKVETPELMTKEEKEYYDFYFIEINPFNGGHKEDELILEHWYDFADFCFKDDIETEVEEFIQENLADLQDNYIDDDTIYQLDLDGNIIAKFETQADAALALGIKNAANINNAVLGKQQTAHGYRWVKAKNYRPSTQLSLWDNL